MNREIIIEKTLQALKKLPDEKAIEVADFTEFVLKRYEEGLIQRGIEKIISDSDSFNFLNEEETLYTTADIKEKL